MAYRGTEGHWLANVGSIIATSTARATPNEVTTDHLDFLNNTGEGYFEGNFEVDGILYTDNGRNVNTTRYTTTQTQQTSDHHVACDTDGGAFTYTLAAGVAGKELRIANTGTSSNNLTIAPNGAELLIGLNSNFVLGDGEALHIVYESTEGWF